MKDKPNLLKKVRSGFVLHGAWTDVRENGLQSTSRATRREINEFASKAQTNLKRLYGKLQKGTFQFSKALGVLKQRPGKAPRPIVIAPIEDRIVQRCILDVLQSQEAVSSYVSAPTSFGGLKNRGVPDAIRSLVSIIKEHEMKYYIRSDIADFFGCIPKDLVLSKIASLIGGQPDFISFVRDAVSVNVKNVKELGANISLFPSSTIGVAQGCCLSSLMGNVLLHDFDSSLNGRGVACIRYVDDFIILAKNERTANAAFASATKILSKFNLKAYEPSKSRKAKSGSTDGGIDFLGCNIIPGLISPSDEAKKTVYRKIHEQLTMSEVALTQAISRIPRGYSLIDTLLRVSKILQGWGDQYSFCNDGNAFLILQKRISERINQYLDFYRKKCRSSDLDLNFRLLGVHLLSDRKLELGPSYRHN